jgi:GNAT superfamily N-acetyltransferase
MSATPDVYRYPQFDIRLGVAAEIDTLSDIDLDAGALFERAGLYLNLPANHEFLIAEETRWLRSLMLGKTLVAVAPSGAPVGFAASGLLDGQPYLDQLSVRTQAMGRGIGSALLRATEHRARQSGGRHLWLTTYGHLAWNRPFYERAGFIVVPESNCGPEILETLAFERRWLPRPADRVVMKKDFNARH